MIWRLVDWLIHVKFAINRAFSHVAIALTLFNTTATLAILLKLNDMSMWTSVVIGASSFIVLYVVGSLDMHFGVFSRERSKDNQFNPEIQKLIRLVEELKSEVKK